MKDALVALAEMNYQGVELCLEHPELDLDSENRWSASKLIDFLRHTGLEATAVSFHGKRSGWEEKRRKCLAGLEMANNLGVDVFITGSILGEGSNQFTQMCRFTEEMCRSAEQSAVNFAVEPEPGTVINGSREMNALLNAVGSTRLKMNLDIGHSYLTEGDVCADITRWGSLIIHTHFEDIKGKIHRHLLPGEGDLDFKLIAAAFDNINYRGFFTIDLFDIQDNPEYIAREAIEALWKKLTE